MSVPKWCRCDECGVFVPASLGQQVRPRTLRYPPWLCEACRIATEREAALPDVAICIEDQRAIEALPQTLPQN